jgi:hypothetical protein
MPLTIAAALLALASGSPAQTIINGDLTGVADFTSFNNVAPPGWTNAWGGTDLWNQTSTAFNTTWLASNGGGTFVHGVGTFLGAEWISQQVTGLTVGATYQISFEQTVSNGASMQDTHGFWRVDFGPDTFFSSHMPKPPLGTPYAWETQTMPFTASSTTQLLKFTAMCPTNSSPPFRIECGIDTISIAPGCTTPLPGSETVRLGTPPNPFALLPGTSGPPTIGIVWDPVIDHTTFVPNATLDVFAISAIPANIPTPPAGTTLCTTPFLYEFRSPGASLDFPIPYDCALVGVRLCVSAASFDTTSNFFLTNALDISIGSF